MALVDADGTSGKMFFSLFDGSIKRNVDKNSQGARGRINKSGKTVYEKFYRSISGRFIKIEKKSHEEFGDSWVIDLRDGEETYSLQIPYSSRQADGFLRRVPLLELEKDLEITCGVYDGKPYLTLKQNGGKVEYYWTREKPGSLPPMVQIQVKGKYIWDDTDKMAYLERYVNERLIPKLTELNPVVESELPPTELGGGNNDPMPEFKPSVIPSSNNNPPIPEEDDLPF